MPGTILDILRELLVLLLTTTLEDSYFFPHFMGEETKPWRT